MNHQRVYVDSSVLVGATSLEDDKDVRNECEKFFKTIKESGSIELAISGLVLGEFLIKCFKRKTFDPIREVYVLIGDIHSDWILAPKWPFLDREVYEFIEKLNEESVNYLNRIICEFLKSYDINTTARDLKNSDKLIEPSDSLILAFAVADEYAKWFITIEERVIKSVSLRQKINETRRKKGYQKLTIMSPGDFLAMLNAP